MKLLKLFCLETHKTCQAQMDKRYLIFMNNALHSWETLAGTWQASPPRSLHTYLTSKNPAQDFPESFVWLLISPVLEADVDFGA